MAHVLFDEKEGNIILRMGRKETRFIRALLKRFSGLPYGVEWYGDESAATGTLEIALCGEDKHKAALRQKGLLTDDNDDEEMLNVG